ncbi:hypothetical protein M3D15_04000 [Pseudoclavibacter alba]|uniref:DUF222 domain-containing protein n=1 Tax=Pseudoclavibacter albus TaxID=272241 RepID=A0ABT2HVZ7_9MICO|nr:hypothetical protein [Pseudoclavibacter alba]MCT2042498.1 hypothetical protein [Pseudoclavibacter alba]
MNATLSNPIEAIEAGAVPATAWATDPLGAWQSVTDAELDGTDAALERIHTLTLATDDAGFSVCAEQALQVTVIDDEATTRWLAPMVRITTDAAPGEDSVVFPLSELNTIVEALQGLRVRVISRALNAMTTHEADAEGNGTKCAVAVSAYVDRELAVIGDE